MLKSQASKLGCTKVNANLRVEKGRIRKVFLVIDE
jgi:hypothetical protein